MIGMQTLQFVSNFHLVLIVLITTVQKSFDYSFRVFSKIYLRIFILKLNNTKHVYSHSTYCSTVFDNKKIKNYYSDFPKI